MAESRRAAPLPPDERRAAILAAAVPLLRASGGQASTKELAAAAGVAEGTLFRVFPDKHALFVAAMTEAIDASGLVTRIAAIDPAADLIVRITELAHILGAHLDALFELGMMLKRQGESSPRHLQPDEQLQDALDNSGAMIFAAIAGMLAPDRDQLRVTVEQAASVVGALIAGTRMPGPPGKNRLSDQEVAQCVVHGVSSRG
ncbi:MAG: TetR/AcrR family transcriptional regulator [Candidatus Nanopelagicales bacterium]